MGTRRKRNQGVSGYSAELPKNGEIKPRLYVSYEINETELDGGIDWPDVGVATVFAVLENGRKEFIGEVRAYNWEAIWAECSGL